MRTARRVGILMAGVVGALAMSAPVSSAAVGDTAPSCISRPVYSTPDGFDVFLTNNCGRTMSVKVIVDNGGDSNCYVMSAGTSHTFSYSGIFGTYGKTVIC
ncbi:beta-Ig-H3/fasciclin [Streptomyces lannensis]|uniref:Beta-Ig-H3/fasciclin n=1 Tax=Streptomyces lannensis TaxID=766498 RepID=A0ABP7LQQ2_9ACTN